MLPDAYELIVYKLFFTICILCLRLEFELLDHKYTPLAQALCFGGVDSS